MRAILRAPSLSSKELLLSAAASEASSLASSVAVVVVANRSTDEEFSSTITRGKLLLAEGERRKFTFGASINGVHEILGTSINDVRKTLGFFDSAICLLESTPR